MIKPSDATIVVCGIVRDAEKGLRNNIPVIKKVISIFADYRVIMFENDSKDRTKELLREWMASDPDRVVAVMEDTNSSTTIPSAKIVKGVNPFFSHKRIDRMAKLRNRYLRILYDSQYPMAKSFEPDYVMVVDMDVAQLYADGIKTSFDDDKEWDAVCAFGYSISPKLKRRYHDTYALTLWGDQEQPQTELKIKTLAESLGKIRPDDEWVRIASGFGGLAIYRYEAMKGLWYSEPALDNNDPQVEVRCEHFSLYKQMIERGYDRFYINPAMVLKYQNITIKIIWNSFKRSMSQLLKRNEK